MSLYQTPPAALSIGGKLYPIDTDFRVWITFQKELSAKAADSKKAERLCAFMEHMGLPPCKESLDAMLAFYEAESQEKHIADSKNRAMSFDFEKDSEFIFSAFLGAYNIDLETALLHWWKFKALFKSLPDNCQFSRIMQYRTVDLKDVPKNQRRFYQEQKARYSLGESTPHRTEKDMRDYVKRRFEEAQKQTGKEVEHG